MYTKEQLFNDLRKMNLKSTDTVLIHTSMKAIGEVEGRADGFIDIMCEYFKDGLLLIPTHTWDNVTKDAPVYDVSSTIPCIGIIPTRAAFRKDGYRSLHPTHSIWGYGKNAQEFLKGEETATTPAPIGGAWARLTDVNAKILLIGVGHNRNTFIHAVDELVDLPNRLHPTPFNITIIDQNKNEFHTSFHCHYCTKSDDVSQYFVNFEKAFVELGAQYIGKLGNAEVKIVDAKKIQDILVRIYANAKEDLCISYMDIPEVYYKTTE